MFCVLIRLDTQDVVFRFFIGFGGGRQAMSGRSFRGKKTAVFSVLVRSENGGEKHKTKKLRCTRFKRADGQVGGGAAVEYPVAAAARLS